MGDRCDKVQVTAIVRGVLLGPEGPIGFVLSPENERVNAVDVPNFS
jgi:hypothetical protein